MATVPITSDLEVRLEEERRRIGDTLDEIRSVLRRDMNVRRQMARHITPTLVVCAVVGIVIGRLVRSIVS
jgi:hypothetical protein